MKNLWTVLSFEFQMTVKKKSFILSTAMMLLIVFALTFIPTFMKMFRVGQEDLKEGGSQVGNVDEEDLKPKFGVFISDSDMDYDTLKTYFVFESSKYYDDEEALKRDVIDKKIQEGLVISSGPSARLYNYNASVDSYGEVYLDALKKYYRDRRLEEKGIDVAEVDEAEAVTVEFEVQSLGKNAAAGFVFAYVGMFAIYISILTYGIGVATSVAREKNDRTMEILITNTSSTSLIVGKVLSQMIISTGFLALLVVFIGLGVSINKANYPEFLIMMLKEGISLPAVVVFLVYMMLGSLLYYFVYASLGALVSKVEEVASAVSPIQWIFILGFVLASVGLRMPDSLMMRVASLIPFTSLFAMFIRYNMTVVPLNQLIVSLIFLVLMTGLMSYIAIKIYRMGTLNYGNRISLTKAVRGAFKKDIE